MDISFSFIHLIVIIGAVQGFTLCAFVAFLRKARRKPRRYFLVFLSSLAILNTAYVVLDIDLLKVYRPLHLFPYPYKWLIGPSIFFYIASVIPKNTVAPTQKRRFILWLPAISYGLLSSYWFIISVKENSYRLAGELVDLHVFRINETLYLLFTLILSYLALRSVWAATRISKGITLRRCQLLRQVLLFFLFSTIAQLIIFTLDMILHDGQETFSFIYATLIFHILFIYYLGYLGFKKSSLLFPSEVPKNEVDEEKTLLIESNLISVLDEDELYRNPKLTLSFLANAVDISPRELSNHIRHYHGLNFSEYINGFRIEKVKKLLHSGDSEKYTLLYLSQEAGFSSKSTFNATFKKLVKMTPSEYRKKESAG